MGFGLEISIKKLNGNRTQMKGVAIKSVPKKIDAMLISLGTSGLESVDQVVINGLNTLQKIYESISNYLARLKKSAFIL